MKKKSIEKVLAMVIAASVAITPMSTFAAEGEMEGGDAAIKEAPAVELAVETPAPAAVETKAPAAEEAKALVDKAEVKEVAEVATPAAEQAQEEVQKPADTKMYIVVNFNNIMSSKGTVSATSVKNTLSPGSGWSFGQKKLDNKVTYKSFTYNGVSYKYSGKWVDENGNEFTSLSVKNNGQGGTIVYNISPVYEKAYPEVLDFRYIDNISTGSGSAKNLGSASKFKHTFKEPEGQLHYKFVEWKNLESNEAYQPGEAFEYTLKKDLPEETITSVNIHAMWQPSITVEYYSNGALLKTVESTDSALAAYDYNAADAAEVENGADFNGWFESAEEGAARVEEGTVFDLPAITSERTEQKVVKLYAKYTVDYTVEHYTENLNGSFKLAEVEEVKGAPLGADVFAEAKEFKGYTFNKEIEGTLTEAKASKGLALKLYYNRNSEAVPSVVVPTAAASSSDSATPAAAANTQTAQIADNAVPQAASPMVVNDNEMPLAQTGAWALINLICAAATALLSLIMLAVHFWNRREEDEQLEENNSKARIASLIPAIGAIIAFILTEDMSLPMAMTDKWTILMIAILGIQAGVGIYAKLRDNDEYEENDEARA